MPEGVERSDVIPVLLSKKQYSRNGRTRGIAGLATFPLRRNVRAAGGCGRQPNSRGEIISKSIDAERQRIECLGKVRPGPKPGLRDGDAPCSCATDAVRSAV